MRMARLAIGLTVLPLIGVSPAFADEPDTQPLFALMDNTGDGTKFDAEVAVVEVRSLDGSLIVPRIAGQYVSAGGLGGYATTIAGLYTGQADSDGGTGNLELGGLYRFVLGPHFDLGIRAGLMLPTGGNEVAVLSLAVARPADLVLGARDTTALRLGISPTLHHGPFALRMDFGVDEVLDSPGNTDAILHLNFGIGVGGRQWSATAEYARVFTRDDRLPALQNIGVSLRYRGNTVSPYFAISTPLEDELRDDAITVALGLTLTP